MSARRPVGSGGYGRIRIGQRYRGIVIDEEVFADKVLHMGYHSGADFLEHVDFLDTIRSGSPPKLNLDEGMWSVAFGRSRPSLHRRPQRHGRRRDV